MSDTTANQAPSGGASYEELMNQSRALSAQGDVAGARRVARAALEARQLQLRQLQLSECQRRAQLAVEAFRNGAAASQASIRGEAEPPFGGIAEASAGSSVEPQQSPTGAGGFVTITTPEGKKVRLPKGMTRQQMADALNSLPGAKPKEQKGLGQRTREFFLGDDDPTTQNLGERIGTALNKAGESLTFGLIGDEASAAVESVLPGVDYETRRDHYRQQEEQFTQDHPLGAIIAELAPLAIPGVGAAAAGGKGAGLAARMARGGAVAGAQGATYGFTEGEGGLEQRLEDAGTNAAVSASIGMAMPVAARSIQRSLDRRANSRAVRQMVSEAPTSEQLKSAASGRYTAGRARGSLASPGDAQSLVDDVTATLKREGVMRANGDLITRDPDARRILEELQDIATYGLESNQVKPVRDIFKAAARDSDPARARIGSILQKKFDDFVAERAPEFAEGDKLYSRAKKVEAVDQMVDLADTSDSASALRNEFRKADRNQIKGKFGGMSDDEVTAIQRVARGSGVENTARAAGRSAPRSIGSALYTGGVPLTAGALAGSPTIGAAVGGAALGAGMIGQAVSNRMQSKHAEIARALMATGGRMPKASASDALKRKIAEALAAAAPRSTELFAGY